MAYTFIIVGLCIIFALVIGILNYYGNRKTSPWYVRLSVIIGWFFPFSIVLVLPLDVSSSIYRGLTDEEKLNTKPPIGYQSEEFFTIFWNITYWISYVFTWLVLPLLSGYILSGHFTPLKKFKDSIYQNIIFYGVLGGIGIIFVIYIAIARQMTGKALIAFLMAMSNAWGLLLCVVFLGYGLVDIPRRFWRKSDLSWIRNYYQFKAPKLKDATLTANEELQKVVREIFKISNAIDSRHPLRPYIEKLIELCPINNDSNDNPYDEHENINSASISINDLALLNYKLKYAILSNYRCNKQYKRLIEKALHIEDILDNKNNPNKMIEFPSNFISDSELNMNSNSDSNSNTNSSSLLIKLKNKLAWRWYFNIRPYILLSFSIILILLSVSIIWSEVTFQLYNSNISLFYIYLKYSKYLSNLLFEFIIFALLVYMSVCTYTSLFKLQLFEYYRLFPHHHTDDNSLVFCAAYLCRLIFPLCYNFLNLTGDTESAFTKIMGKMDLVPLLGKEFNGYVPIMIIVFTFITFFNIHGKFLKKFGIDDYFGVDHFSMNNDDDLADIQDGEILIQQAKRQRDRNSTNYILYSNNNIYNSYSNSNINISSSNNYHLNIKNDINNFNSNSHHPNNKNNQKRSSNSNHNSNNNLYSSDSPQNTQNSAFDYPFHFKSQNNNYAYAAPSSTEYNQRYGSYNSNSNSNNTFYTPSVGGGTGVNSSNHNNSNSNHNNHNNNNNNNNNNNTLNSQHFYTSSNTSNSNLNLLQKQQNQNSSLHHFFSISSKPKKKNFGFNINSNANAFYNNYPPLASQNQSQHGQKSKGKGQGQGQGQIQSSSHARTTTTSSDIITNNSYQNSISNGGGSPPSNSNRKFGYKNPTGSSFSSPTNSIKSKTRMFGVNYKLNS